ncbi:hypothetical protein KY347_04000 [Candidatus Woesearchaeota archaeon]|nr:hypothetical protein [Candidatus Woesearchaeota archaeon]
MIRQGTEKFVIYFYNGKAVRGGIVKPKNFTYYQWGMIKVLDDKGKEIESKRFANYGQMINFINQRMRKAVMKNLKGHKTWD